MDLAEVSGVAHGVLKIKKSVIPEVPMGSLKKVQPIAVWPAIPNKFMYICKRRA